MAGDGGGFRELEAWRYGMELAVRVFDLTAEEAVAGEALRSAALEVPQQIASGAMDGRPKSWARCLALAQGALDRLEAEARELWAAPDARMLELVAEVRQALDALEAAPLWAESASPPEAVEVAAA